MGLKVRHQHDLAVPHYIAKHQWTTKGVSDQGIMGL